jgi:hypothetical protein
MLTSLIASTSGNELEKLWGNALKKLTPKQKQMVLEILQDLKLRKSIN